MRGRSYTHTTRTNQRNIRQAAHRARLHVHVCMCMCLGMCVCVCVWWGGGGVVWCVCVVVWGGGGWGGACVCVCVWCVCGVCVFLPSFHHIFFHCLWFYLRSGERRGGEEWRSLVAASP